MLLSTAIYLVRELVGQVTASFSHTALDRTPEQQVFRRKTGRYQCEYIDWYSRLITTDFAAAWQCQWKLLFAVWTRYNNHDSLSFRRNPRCSRSCGDWRIVFLQNVPVCYTLSSDFVPVLIVTTCRSSFRNTRSVPVSKRSAGSHSRLASNGRFQIIL